MRNKEGMELEVGTIGYNLDIKFLDLVWDKWNPNSRAQYRFEDDTQIRELISDLNNLLSVKSDDVS